MDSHLVTERDFCVCPVNNYPRDSQKLDSVFAAKENQIIMWFVLQTALTFTYSTLEVPAVLPTHHLQAHNFPFFVFSLQAASWKEIRKDSLKSFRACNLHTADAELVLQSGVDENCDIYPELTTFTERHSEDSRARETPRESVYCWGSNLQRSKQRQSSLWGIWTWRTD